MHQIENVTDMIMQDLLHDVTQNSKLKEKVDFLKKYQSSLIDNSKFEYVINYFAKTFKSITNIFQNFTTL